MIQSLNGRDPHNLNWDLVDWGDESPPRETKHISNLGAYDSTKVYGLQVRGYASSDSKTRISKLFSFSKYETFEACMRAARTWRNQNICRPKEMTEEQRAKWRNTVAKSRSVTGVTGLTLNINQKRGVWYPVAAAMKSKTSPGTRYVSRSLNSHTISSIADEFVHVLRELPYHQDKAKRTLHNEIQRGLKTGIRTTLMNNPKKLTSPAFDALRAAARKHNVIH